VQLSLSQFMWDCMQRMYSSSMYVYFPSLNAPEENEDDAEFDWRCEANPQSPEDDEYTEEMDGA
jgi:hypothetical protein